MPTTVARASPATQKEAWTALPGAGRRPGGPAREPGLRGDAGDWNQAAAWAGSPAHQARSPARPRSRAHTPRGQALAISESGRRGDMAVEHPSLKQVKGPVLPIPWPSPLRGWQVPPWVWKEGRGSRGLPGQGTTLPVTMRNRQPKMATLRKMSTATKSALRRSMDMARTSPFPVGCRGHSFASQGQDTTERPRRQVRGLT